MLSPDYCRARQKRLLDRLVGRGLDAVALSLPHHVYYLTGHRTFWLQQSAVILRADGRTQLVAAGDAAETVAVDEVISYEGTWNGTQRQEQPAVVADLVARSLSGIAGGRVGIDSSPVAGPLVARLGGATFVDEDLWQLRRRKDADELELLKRAIACTATMHARAREIVRPGVSELTVFTELHAAAVRVAGEPLSPMHLGNDYRCNAGGGSPRNDRESRPGELYILDLGPAYRGYFADNSRTYAVDSQPTAAQQKAWEIVVGTFSIVESMARPGVRCRDIVAVVDEHYRVNTGQGLPHHLGHGVGLQPHEFPHLNPAWDDTLIEGEIFTCEPGLYGPELAGGMRIENQYLVTKSGVQNLTPFALEL